MDAHERTPAAGPETGEKTCALNPGDAFETPGSETSSRNESPIFPLSPQEKDLIAAPEPTARRSIHIPTR